MAELFRFFLLRIFLFRFNLKMVLVNSIFIVFLYFFDFLNIKAYNLEPIGPEAELTYSLVKTVINEVYVIHSKSFNILHVTRTLNFIQHYFMTTDCNSIQYNFSKFKRTDGSHFNSKSHLNHYNVYLSFQEFQEYQHTIWTHQFTHNLPKNNEIDFKFFSENDITQRYIKQHISSCIRIIDSTYIKSFNDSYVSNDDLLKFAVENSFKITKHFKSSINVN
jgi:hypothetical protein